MFGPGDEVGDYIVVRFLARGGMGAVYQVQNRLSGRVEAMKVVEGNYLAEDPTAAARFLRELEIFASIDHPNVVRLYSAFGWRGRHFMTMEFVDGDTLTALANTRSLPPEMCAELVCHCLSALEHIHQKGIIHRDIKLSNIMVTADGVAKLMDFGVARVQGQTHFTHQGGLAGTLHYVAPELLEGAEPDARTDIYAVGVVLYRLLGGRFPFEGESEGAILLGHQSKLPPPLETLAPGLSPTLIQAVTRALEKDPKRRYQSAREFREVLTNGTRTRVSPGHFVAFLRDWHLPRFRRVLVGSAISMGVIWAGLVLAPRLSAPRAGLPTPSSGSQPSPLAEPQTQPVVQPPAVDDFPRDTTAQAPEPIEESPDRPSSRKANRRSGKHQGDPPAPVRGAGLAMPPPFSRPAITPEENYRLRERLIKAEASREEFSNTLKGVDSSYGLRGTISSAMKMLEACLAEADRAIRNGEAEPAERFLLQSEEQIRVLNRELYRR